MKLLSRDFTTREKGMLLILSCILIVLCYFQFVDRPIRESMSNMQSIKDSINVEMTAVDAKLMNLQEKENELENIQITSDLSVMPSYNNEKKEMNLMHRLLGRTIEYNISFLDITREGNQIRRNFSIHFIAENLEKADHIMLDLYASQDRCLIEDIHYASVNDSNHIDDIKKGTVSVDATVTFYETMVGGVEDAGLPKDALAVEENTEE